MSNVLIIGNATTVIRFETEGEMGTGTTDLDADPATQIAEYAADGLT